MATMPIMYICLLRHMLQKKIILKRIVEIQRKTITVAEVVIMRQIRRLPGRAIESSESLMT